MTSARITRLENLLPAEPTEAERATAAMISLETNEELVAGIEAAMSSPAALARGAVIDAMGRAELWATITAEMAEHPPPRWRQ